MEPASSTDVNPNRSNKLATAEKRLFEVMIRKVFNITIVSGKTPSGQNKWAKVLTDWGKEKQLMQQCNTGSLDFDENYGKILECGFDDNIPSYTEVVNKLYEDIKENICLVKLKTNEIEKVYYVMSEGGKRQEVLSATSVEEIKQSGKILYCSSHESPPESLVNVIEDGYFGLKEYNSTTDSKLFDAAQKGLIPNVKRYLQEGGDVNSADEYGWTLLHHAALKGNTDLISVLINAGANIFLRDKTCGRTFAHIAATEGHCNVLHLFCFERAMDVNDCDNNKWSLLHYAAWKGDLDTVRFLIQNGAEVRAEEISARKQPIHLAARNGHVEVVKLLLDNGAMIEDVDKDGKTPLVYSVAADGLEMSNFLINQGAVITVKTKTGETLVHTAAKNNCKEKIAFFLDAGLKIDEKEINGHTPLVSAVLSNSFDAVKFLVDKGANLNSIKKQTLDFIGKKNTNLFLYLMHEYGKKFEEQDKSSDALKIYKETLAVAIEKLGRENPKTMEIQNVLGKLLFKLGKLDEAKTTLTDVLANSERYLGSSNFDTLCTKHVLGLCYDAQMKYREAIEVLNDVVTRLSDTVGAKNDYTLNVSRDLACTHRKRGHYAEAYEILKDIYEKRNVDLGADDPKTLQAKQDMAVVLVNQGECKTALQLFSDVLCKRKRILGDNHPDTSLAMIHIQSVLEILHKPK